MTLCDWENFRSFRVNECRKLLWHCLTLKMEAVRTCEMAAAVRSLTRLYSPEDLKCSATPPRDPQIFVINFLFVSSIRFGRFGTSALGVGYVEIELQRHPIGDVMRTSDFLNSGRLWYS